MAKPCMVYKNALWGTLLTTLASELRHSLLAFRQYQTEEGKDTPS